jgi:hypothetical protein
MHALEFRETLTITGRFDTMKDRMARSSQDLLTAAGAQIIEILIGKEYCMVLVDNQNTISEMVQDSVLIVWWHAVFSLRQ